MAHAFEIADSRSTLFDALLRAARRFGPRKPILEDQERRPLSYVDLIRASFALGRKIANVTAPGETVGLLLPSSAGGVVTVFALHAYGRVPAMLNFTAGIRNLRAAVKLAEVKRVLTSHRFIEQGKLHDLIDALEERCEITYLEDVRASIGTVDRLRALAASLVPWQARARLKPSDPGVVLFTSGSFGAPRGVVLSHANILANVAQVAAHIDLDPDWVLFNPLPIFHCFGLTAGAMLPIFTGMKAFEYPSPLHIKIIPALVKDSKASILLATDTFVNQYARAAGGDELAGLKFIVCGAEKVREETPQPHRRPLRPGARARRLRRHRGLARDRGQQTRGQSPGNRRRPPARNRDPHHPCARDRQGGPAAGARAERHDRISERGRRAGAARGRLA